MLIFFSLEMINGSWKTKYAKLCCFTFRPFPQPVQINKRTHQTIVAIIQCWTNIITTNSTSSTNRNPSTTTTTSSNSKPINNHIINSNIIHINNHNTNSHSR